MRIAEVSRYYPPHVGGIEDHVQQCSIGLSDEHDIHVLASNTSRKTIKEYEEGVHVLRLQRLGEVASQPIMPALPYYLWRLEPDLVHLHTPNPVGVWAYLVATPRTPVVVTHHGDIARYPCAKHLVLPFYKYILQRAEAVLLFTRRYGRTSTELKYVQNKIKVIPHGVKENHFKETTRVEEEANHLREEIAAGAPTVTFIGRMVGWKGVDVLLRALAKVPKVHAFLGGDGPTLEEHKRTASQLGIANRVHFFGHLDDQDKVPVFYAGDIFVLPSTARSESFGIVQVEAQLCRKPIIVSEVGGAPEVTKNGETGIVVPPGKVDEMSKAIERLIQDKFLRDKLGEAGYYRAKENYVESKTVPKLRQFFGKLESKIL